MNRPFSTSEKRLYRLAVLIVCLVWPLIWIGGLVTTYDAGMAVPDWPNTYGYNLFLYPIETWIAGPFDLLIEHGHRLLAALIGFLSIGLVVLAWLYEERPWVRYLALGVLVAVIGQGVLGGLRVVLSDRTLAMIHGCVGPAFFALCTATAVVTGPWWREPESVSVRAIGRWTRKAVLTVCVLSFGQLVLGAMLRHAKPTLSAFGFSHIVKTHLIVAFILLGLAIWVSLYMAKCGNLTLRRSGRMLLGCVAIQILLGILTWVVNYGFPSVLDWVPWSRDYIVQAKGFLESILITAHVATGSLILALAIRLAMRVARFNFWQKAVLSTGDV
jgi:cytochrome c oxidase assembly protein subunit 15